MKQPINTLRLLAEIIGVVVLIQVALMFLVPAVVPDATLPFRLVLYAAMLSVIAAPFILWRVHYSIKRAGCGIEIEGSPTRWRSSVAAIAILLVGATLTIVAVRSSMQDVRQQAQTRFEYLNEKLATEIPRRVEQSLHGLLGARGVYAAHNAMQRHEFGAYVASRDLAKDSPGAISIGFMVHVQPDELDTFIEAERKNPASGFSIHGPAAVGSGRLEEPGLYLVKHVFPADPKEKKWSYEAGSELVRWNAAEKAVLSGQPTMSGKIYFFQEEAEKSARQAGFQYLVPVYRNGTNPITPEERREALVGLVYTPIILKNALEDISGVVDNQLEFSIFEGSEPSLRSQLAGPPWSRYATATDHQTREVPSDKHLFDTRTQIKIGGRNWLILTNSTSQFNAGIDHSTPYFIGFSGTLLTLFAAAVTWTLGLSRRRAMNLALGMTADLSAAKAAAEAAIRDKCIFLANMSHEIRTPLTSIIGFTEMLMEEGNNALPPSQRQIAIRTVRNASSHLLNVVNDVVDLSTIDADKMTIEHVDTPLVGILHEVESLLRPLASGKGLFLKVVLATPVPVRIKSDPARLRQILMSLAGNAVKSTDFGGITIAVRIEHRAEGQRLIIDLTDTGEGISASQTQVLFDPFGKPDPYATRYYGNTGLDMSLCCRFATLMGGAVTLAHTALGRGSCFRVDLPLEPIGGTPMITHFLAVEYSAPFGATHAPTSLNGRILVAEDGPDNQRLIAFHLKKAGATVDVAENGRIALDLINKAAATGSPYSLLVTDMQMPELDGYELARTLRMMGSTLPIVALTAHALSDDRAKCIDAGCDDFATKPIDKHALISTCAMWIAAPRLTIPVQRAVA